MNKRTFLIMIGLAVPVIALIFLTRTQPAPEHHAAVVTPMSTPAPVRASETREAALMRLQKRQSVLLSMTDAQWDEETKQLAGSRPNRPKTLEAARDRIKTRIASVQGMTDAQWQHSQAAK